MRRFISSLPGRVVSQMLAVALMLPMVTLGLVTKAEAQLQVLPTWAVLEFNNLAPQGGPTFGQVAAEAVSNELAKTNQYDILPQETIRRTVDSLNIKSPVVGQTNILRVAQELRATIVVSGELVNYRIVSNPSGKHAEVKMRVIVIDAASGLPINGSAVTAASADRVGDVTDESLVNEAIAQAATIAVNDIQTRVLPQATVLNTVTDRALINQGARAGFEPGQQVIVSRGREQVATAVVTETDPDSAYVKIVRNIKGIQPGDRVRVIFQVPMIPVPWSRSDRPAEGVVKVQRKSSSNAGFVQGLIVFGILGIALGGGRASSNNLFTSVRSEAGTFTGDQVDFITGVPGVRISYGLDFFIRGNSQRVQFQIYRSDVVGIPVLVVPGDKSVAVDSDVVGGVELTYADFQGVVGGTSCDNTTVPTNTTTTAGLTLGRPYHYSVELIYRMSSLDLPGPIGTAQDCFFASSRASAIGQATPLQRPQLVNPQPNATISQNVSFTFNSVVNVNFPAPIEYCVQLSTQPSFPAGQTVTLAKFVSNSLGVLSTTQVNTSGSNIPVAIRNASTVWWRIGARNTADNPGPVPDPSGQRFVFSAARQFVRPLTPPGDPG